MAQKEFKILLPHIIELNERHRNLGPILMWCENITGQWGYQRIASIDCQRFFFSNKADALLFKLTWVGQ